MKTILTSLLVLLAFLSCGQTVTHKTITIGPHKSFEAYEHFNRLTLNSPDSNVEFIDGFDFEWGYTYRLDVEETKFIVSFSDGTDAEHSLNRIISKTRVSDSTEFRLFLDSELYPYEVHSSEVEMNKTFVQLNDSTFNYMKEIEIEIPAHLKEKFRQVTDEKKAEMGTFVFISSNRIRLVGL